MTDINEIELLSLLLYFFITYVSFSRILKAEERIKEFEKKQRK